MKARAITKVTKQIGPDDFEIQPRILDIDEKTTIKDLYDWYSNLHKSGNVVFKAESNLIIQF